jgi:predicted 2-oxoglutarate/Fe(II)-dependent dioxygenase YbiX
MGAHRDNELDDSVLFGIVIYLNDNYEGGEIYYQDLDLKIKPKARSMVIHPAGIKHEVLNVKGNNTRYTFSVFVRGNAKTKLRDMSEVLIWN